MKNLLLGLTAVTLSLASVAQEPFRCATDEMRRRVIEMDPTYLEREAEYEEEIRELIRNNAQVRDGELVITIPIVFHVLHLGGEENISDEQIHDQVAILNRDYRKLNADLSTVLPHFQSIAGDAFIEFSLPTRDPFGNCTNGIDRINSVQTLRGNDNSKLNPWPRSQYLNVWTTDIILSGAAGYAYIPGSAEGFMQLADGIMILHNYVGSIGTSYVGGSRALTHEVGHFLNLHHTWGQTNDPVIGACGDDGVEDTPLTRGHNNCQNRYDYQCSSTPFYNMMDFYFMTTSPGTQDPTPLPNPRVIRNPGAQADTMAIGVGFEPAMAVGLSGNSLVAEEFAFSGWDVGAADSLIDPAELQGDINGDKYYEFTFTPDIQVAMNAQQIVFSARRSEDGPRTFAVRQGPGFSGNIAMSPVSGVQVLPGQAGSFFVNDHTTEWINNITVNLPAVGSGADLQQPITIRIYAWNAESADGFFSVDNIRVIGTLGEIENLENYMEYAFCQKMFTEDQTARMRAALNSSVGQRNELWTEGNLQATGILEGFQMSCAPIADFYAVPGSTNGSFDNPAIPYPPLTCSGMDIMFKDNSGGGEATGWSWTFQDGEPATSNEQNPEITFTQPGWKQVTLTVSNDVGSSSKTSPFEVYVSNADDAMHGLASYSFEEDLATWPFIFENYEGNHTQFHRYTGAGHTGNACIKLNSGDREEWNFINPHNSGDIDDLISPNLDLTGIQDATLSFWYSYSTQTTVLDTVDERLIIQRSIDCGRSWQFISSESAGTIREDELITNGNSPTPTSWEFKSMNIPASLLTSNVRFRFRFVSSQFSNNLFIDDINIGGPVGISEASGNVAMTVYPNPTNDQFFVEMVGMDIHETEITLMDSRGAIVHYAKHAPQGGQGVMISARELDLADGLYTLRVANVEGTSVQKLIVGR